MDKILNNIGLCMRAGALVTGLDIVEEGLRSGKVCYIFLAKDASSNTRKVIYDKAKFYNAEVCEDYSSAELNQATGKMGRMVFGVTEKGFLKILKK